MKNTQPFLPGLHLSSLRKKPRSTGQKCLDEKIRKRSKSIAGLKACFGRFIPEKLLQNNTEKKHSRHRIFSKENTFWAFFSQIIDADGGCAEVVRKMQAHLSLHGNCSLSASTGSYCKSRAKLEEKELAEIFTHTATSFEVHPDDQPLLDTEAQGIPSGIATLWHDEITTDMLEADDLQIIEIKATTDNEAISQLEGFCK